VRVAYNVKRLQDVARALWLQRELHERDSWTRERLADHQRRCLTDLIDHARRHSDFYRDLYADVKPGAELAELPVVTKEAFMANFDAFVTDRRLRLSDLQSHVETLTRDDYYLGEYRVLTSSGSSGLKGVFVFSRGEWSWSIAAVLRYASMTGLRSRVRVASVGGPSPLHGTYRLSVSMNLGLLPSLRLEATDTLEHIVSELNAFQPEVLAPYASIAWLLAIEQVEGRLRIKPRIISTSSEVLTPETKGLLHEAWGCEPFNIYGISEAGGVIGVDCDRHEGIHLFEDLCLFEVVDDENRPVPKGTPGRKLLITNLVNRVQPFIRYEVSDLVTMETHACSCGRPFRLARSIDGRRDDLIYLENRHGRSVPVHPIHFRSPLAGILEVREYQVVQQPGRLLVRLSLRPGSDAGLVEGKVKNRFVESLGAQQITCPQLDFDFVERFERDHRVNAKFKLVVSNVMHAQTAVLATGRLDPEKEPAH
jgi:phenylacetate-coenzyme A ligase PaaK-like adenylate-forming protein